MSENEYKLVELIIKQANEISELKSELKNKETVIETILDSTSLNYRKDGLQIEADDLTSYLKFYNQNRVRARINYLKTKEDENVK